MIFSTHEHFDNAAIARTLMASVIGSDERSSARVAPSTGIESTPSRVTIEISHSARVPGR
jgi:hypothetical protein